MYAKKKSLETRSYRFYLIPVVPIVFSYNLLANASAISLMYAFRIEPAAIISILTDLTRIITTVLFLQPARETACAWEIAGKVFSFCNLL